MCTLLLAWQVDPAGPLIVAANRDEFCARPTEAARFRHAAGHGGGAGVVVEFVRA